MMTPLMEARRGWWRPKIIPGFEENLGQFLYQDLMDIMRIRFEINLGLWKNMRYETQYGQCEYVQALVSNLMKPQMGQSLLGLVTYIVGWNIEVKIVIWIMDSDGS